MKCEYFDFIHLFLPQVVLKLTQMIGKNVKLYDMVLQFLRTLFLRTRNVHYCTLRAELLMSLHDLDISEICSVDPCHKVSYQFHTRLTVWLLNDMCRILPFHKLIQNNLLGDLHENWTHLLKSDFEAIPWSIWSVFDSLYIVNAKAMWTHSVAQNEYIAEVL